MGTHLLHLNERLTVVKSRTYLFNVNETTAKSTTTKARTVYRSWRINGESSQLGANLGRSSRIQHCRQSVGAASIWVPIYIHVYMYLHTTTYLCAYVCMLTIQLILCTYYAAISSYSVLSRSKENNSKCTFCVTLRYFCFSSPLNLAYHTVVSIEGSNK